MNHTFKAALAEAVGLFCFTFVGAGAICASAAFPGAGVNLLTIALAHGLMMAINIAALGAVSGGQFNPAVTFALALTGREKWGQAAWNILGQCAGAAVAAFALQAFFPPAVQGPPAMLGATLLNPDLSLGHGILVEAILTFILVTAIMGTAVSPRGPKHLAPFAIGLAIAMDILVGGPLTGASMNPARSFGPALALGNWNNFVALDVVGPLLGGSFAAFVFDWAFLAPAAGRRGR